MIELRVAGVPGPQGSKRLVGRHMIESSKKVRPWRNAVVSAFLDAGYGERDCLDVPVEITLTFYFRRPRSHYRTGRNAHMLRDAAPDRPTSGGDIDKLQRSTLDGLTDAGAWTDDRLVCAVIADKRYVEANHAGGAHITIMALPATASSR